MKKTIGLTLSIIWVLLFTLLLAEPTPETTPTSPEWGGWVYLILLFGLPIVIIKLARQN
jgi:hypothetical protein